MTWVRYRTLVIIDKRIVDGRQALSANRALFDRVHARFGVAPNVIAGIWGLESSFGAGTGDFRVVEALATLGWEGRRAGFFRGELLAALKILEHGDVAPVAMTGSYAGAMGQPQFMPTSYLRYAVDFEGHGRRDIWTSTPDVLGSIANYLAQSGWRDGQTWGQPVIVPPGFAAEGRDAKRPLGEWARSGVRPVSGRWAGPAETPAGIVAPDGPGGGAGGGAGGETFAVFGNFAAIRRYNPSDFYAIAVGLIGDQVLG
jgi:membrane-bound lytic murein transglycosylase B